MRAPVRWLYGAAHSAAIHEHTHARAAFLKIRDTQRRLCNARARTTHTQSSPPGPNMRAKFSSNARRSAPVPRNVEPLVCVCAYAQRQPTMGACIVLRPAGIVMMMVRALRVARDLA